MARPREFDIDAAIDRAMGVFWEKGYEGAGLSELLDEMQISRSSLYQAFKDKKTLFARALERYDETVLSPGIALLMGNEPADGRARVDRFFKNSLEAIRRGDARGCFLCNAAAGAAVRDQELSAAIRAMLARLTAAFHAALLDGRDPDERQSADCLAEARRLTARYVGLRVLARTERDGDVLRHSAQLSFARSP